VITIEGEPGARLCTECAIRMTAVSAARQMGQRLGGPIVALVAELAAGLAFGQAQPTGDQRDEQKAVKAAMSSRPRRRRPRR